MLKNLRPPLSLVSSSWTLPVDEVFPQNSGRNQDVWNLISERTLRWESIGFASDSRKLLSALFQSGYSNQPNVTCRYRMWDKYIYFFIVINMLFETLKDRILNKTQWEWNNQIDYRKLKIYHFMRFYFSSNKIKISW